MQKIKRYKSILLVNTDPIKNAGHIKSYFISNSNYFASYHFFPGFSKRRPYFELYENGLLKEKKEFELYRGNNFILKTLNSHLGFYYMAFFKAKGNGFFITNAPLYLFGSSVLKLIKSYTPVLWLGDYYVQNRFPMNIYNSFVRHYNLNLNYVIYLNPRLKKVYITNNKVSQRKIINLGIRKNYSKTNRIGNKITKVGFIGVIRKQQGLDLFFKYLSENNDCFLEVVGEGYDLNYYKKLAVSLKITKKVKFYGVVEDLSKVMPKWDIGIALYENTKDNLSQYAEPTKIKDYLSFGIPVITTKTTYFYKEIEKYKAGCVVEETTESLRKAIYKIMKSYNTYSNGVEKIVKKYEYKNWYEKNFKFLENI